MGKVGSSSMKVAHVHHVPSVLQVRRVTPLVSAFLRADLRLPTVTWEVEVWCDLGSKGRTESATQGQKHGEFR